MNTPSDTRRRAISIRQPMAWAVIHAGKDVENCTAPLQVKAAVGCLVFVHASSHRMSRADVIEAAAYLKARGVEMPDELQLGGVIGSVMVVDIVERHRSRWFHGPFALVLADPRPVRFRPARGQVGLFRVPST
jgi:hypothetical protein